jgi:hypothetical protein
MFKKLFIGLAPLLAVAAFAVMPVAAQATGHYYSNGLKIAEGSKKTVIAWGTITLAGVKGGTLPNHITCHNAAGGSIENPVGGGAGVGATEVFVAYECEQENICPAGTVGRATAERIVNNGLGAGKEAGWPNVLSEPEAEKWRTESSRVKVDIGCFLLTEPETRAAGEHFVELGGYGTETAGLLQKPETHKGTNAAHPGGVVFGSGSGELQGEAAGEALTGKTEGEVKTLGYLNQELINVKQ